MAARLAPENGQHMACFGIKFRASARDQPCGLCGKETASGVGPELVLAETASPVCRDCGRKEAPHLAALLVLAQVAERVGRIKRHTLVPPLEALLDLAQAAEDYVQPTLAGGTEVPKDA